MEPDISTSSWFVYIICCSDGSYYTGATNNVEKRIKQHNAGRGAKYTRGRLPVELLRFFELSSKSEALKFEYYIKKQNKKVKLSIIKQGENNRYVKDYWSSRQYNG